MFTLTQTQNTFQELQQTAHWNYSAFLSYLASHNVTNLYILLPSHRDAVFFTPILKTLHLAFLWPINLKKQW